jgi:hypothetical protein
VPRLRALTAACYDSQAREPGLGVPELWLPEDGLAAAGCEPDGAQLVRQEGWIYLSKWIPDSRAGSGAAMPTSLGSASPCGHG